MPAALGHMATDLAPAGLAALLGGVAAAALTLSVTAWRERGRRRRTDAAALQLVIFEIGNAQRAASNIRGNALATAFPVTAWESERLRLAQFLAPEAWLLTTAVYDAIHGLNWRYQFDRDHAGLTDPDGEPYSRALTAEQLELSCQKIDLAAAHTLPVLREAMAMKGAV